MKVTQHIENANGKPLFSFEILPPLKGQNIQSIFDSIDPLMDFNPPFIDVTYHREEYEYKELPSGLLEKKIVKKRPGTVGICAAIQNKYHVDAIPHILCGGFNKEDTENLLIDLDFLGIDNVVALRGDALKNETYFKPEKAGNQYASELVTQIDNLNKGIYLDEDLQNSACTSFCIGISGYPEKHMEAPSMDSDIHFLKQKIKNGAEYIITQMFFDNKKFFDFVAKCRRVHDHFAFGDVQVDIVQRCEFAIPFLEVADLDKRRVRCVHGVHGLRCAVCLSGLGGAIGLMHDGALQSSPPVAPAGAAAASTAAPRQSAAWGWRPGLAPVWPA